LPTTQAAYDEGTIHAAYIGFPQLMEMRPTGVLLLQSQELANWQMATFTGVVVRNDFLAKPGVTSLMKQLILIFARANYYYLNNTKEFTMIYAGNLSVSNKIASVINGIPSYVHLLLAELTYPQLKEQVSCEWLGCGSNGRIAWALKDQSEVMVRYRQDTNLAWGSEFPARNTNANYASMIVQESLKDYSYFIDTTYILGVLADGFRDTYHLLPGDTIYLGYAITDIVGKTLNIITADDCSLYPSAKYPGLILTKDIKNTPACVCREYAPDTPCPGQTLAIGLRV